MKQWKNLQVMKKMGNQNLDLTAVYKNVYGNVLYLKLCEKEPQGVSKSSGHCIFFSFLHFIPSFLQKERI